MRRIADVRYAAAVLHWDQEVSLPPKGQAQRARQLSTLSGYAHELSTSDDLRTLIESARTEDLDADQSRNVELIAEDFEKATRFPTEFVVRLSEATSAAYHAWIQARRANDFTRYADAFTHMVELQREKAELAGFDDHPYDALLDDYEPGATVRDLDTLFDGVRTDLGALLAEIMDRPAPDSSFMQGRYPDDVQWAFGLRLLEQMGYDFEAGRQDRSEHPFTTSFGPDDVRVTTRVKDDDLSDMIWSCIHEGGHALYEQGLLADQYGLPLGDSVSLGIHESQSRLWENHVGRSLAYWRCNYADLRQRFPDALGDVSLETFYRGMNRVQPSLIRTDADEVTYHLHVMIRYEIEKDLITGDLRPTDVRDRWNADYQSHLGIDVPDDARGVLQDVHWAHGGFGYFPTYSLGSFYAAQFFHHADQALDDLEGLVIGGELRPLLDWLRTNIHQHGRRYPAAELCRRITGEELNVRYFLTYVREKWL